MIQFGQTLKAAREAKGLTIQQVAETTKMMSSIIGDLENEDFSRIVVPIYGRGFVKLYCEAVGLEPKPMVEEFMNRLSAKEAPKAEPMVELKPEHEQQPSLPPKKDCQRIVIMSIVLLAVLSLIGIGIKALYRATRPSSEKAAASTAVTAPAAPRTPQPIEPLYMD